MQMVEKQYQIRGHPNYTLQGMDVFKNGLHPVKRAMKNGTIGWYIDRKFISRNQIKSLLTNGILTS